MHQGIIDWKENYPKAIDKLLYLTKDDLDKFVKAIQAIINIYDPYLRENHDKFVMLDNLLNDLGIEIDDNLIVTQKKEED